ncbi:MAG: PqqD family protein [Vicinamibacterales bacterium]
MAGEAVLLPPAADHAFFLNASALAIWELCDGTRSVHDILGELQGRYDASEPHLLLDLRTTLEQLDRGGLIDLREATGAGPRCVKFVVGVEDTIYFQWQLAILFESLAGKLPAAWEPLVVVCNEGRTLSTRLRDILSEYGVRHYVAADHPTRQVMDFASGDDRYAPLNNIEALRAVSAHVGDDDMVCLMDTDIFLYGELSPEIFPTSNAVTQNWIVEQERYFSFGAETVGVNLQQLLSAMGCTTPFQPGGVTIFLTGRTLSHPKFVPDCFRFTQVLFLLGRILGVPKVWTAHMASFALAMTVNGIDYSVLSVPELSTRHSNEERIEPGTWYHYFRDVADGGGGAFAGSTWCKQQFRNTDLLEQDLTRLAASARTDHERYFFDLARRAQRKLRA